MRCTGQSAAYTSIPLPSPKPSPPSTMFWVRIAIDDRLSVCSTPSAKEVPQDRQAGMWDSGWHTARSPPLTSAGPVALCITPRPPSAPLSPCTPSVYLSSEPGSARVRGIKKRFSALRKTNLATTEIEVPGSRSPEMDGSPGPVPRASSAEPSDPGASLSAVPSDSEALAADPTRRA